jgi:hypothetical protein
MNKIGQIWLEKPLEKMESVLGVVGVCEKSKSARK